MMKWLRKHTKQIMVVVVLLAMVSFVGAQGLYELLAPNPSDIVLWRAFDHDVTQADMQVAKTDTDVLSQMGIPWQNRSAEGFEVKHWYMLAEEAERHGIAAADTDVEQIVAAVDSQLAEVGGIDMLRKRFGASMSHIRHAIERQLLVQANATRIREATMPSEPQIMHFVQDTQSKAQIRMAVFNAENFIDTSAEFTESEIETQFATHRDVLAEESDDGDGYLFPRRVTIQFVAASPGGLQAQVEVSQEEAIEYWKRNRSLYTETVDVEVPVDSTTTQPAEPETRQEVRELPFSRARDRVMAELRRDKARRIARQAMMKLADELTKPWNSVARDDKTGYKAVPEAARSPEAMQNAMRRVAADFGVELEYGELARATADDIAAHDQLRNAAIPDDRNQPVPLSELAFRVPPFHTPENPEDAGLRLQLFQAPQSPLVDESRSFGRDPVTGQFMPMTNINKYVLFRVVETIESAPPATIDEVRDQVVQDLREKQAYEKMAEVAVEFAAVARHVGLEKALTMFDALRESGGIRTIQSPPAFARMQRRPVAADELGDDESILQPANVQGVGRSQTFVDAVFETTAPDWSPAPLDAPQTERVQTAMAEPAMEPAPKVRLVELPDMHKRVVMELVSYEPVDSNSYATQHRSGGVMMLQQIRQQKAMMDWFDPKNIEARCNYVEVRRSEDTEDGEPATASMN